MPKPTKTLLAKIDPTMAKRFKKRLIDDGLTYRAWLEARINRYLEETKNDNRKDKI